MEYLAIKPSWRRVLDDLTDSQFRRVIIECLNYATAADSTNVGKSLTRVESMAFKGLTVEIDKARETSAKRAQNRLNKTNKNNKINNGQQNEHEPKLIIYQNQNQNQNQKSDTKRITPRARGARAGGVTMSLSQFLDRGKLEGVIGPDTSGRVPPEFAEKFFRDMGACGWTDENGVQVGSPFGYLKSAWSAEQKKDAAAREYQEALDEIPDGR